MAHTFVCPKCGHVYTSYIPLTSATCRNKAAHSNIPVEMVRQEPTPK